MNNQWDLRLPSEMTWALILVLGMLLEIRSHKNLRDCRMVGETCQATLRGEFLFLVLSDRGQSIGDPTRAETHYSHYYIHIDVTHTQICCQNTEPNMLTNIPKTQISIPQHQCIGH